MLDAAGNLRDIRLLDRKEKIEIPVTEASASRTSGPVAHPLIDKLCYVARDIEAFAGAPKAQDEYLELLQAWASQDPAAQGLRSVAAYVAKATLTRDLVNRGLAPVADGQLVRVTEESKQARLDRLGLLRWVEDPEDAVIRWCVEIAGVPESRLWMDPQIKASWIRYVSIVPGQGGLCMASGQPVAALAGSHPKGTVSSAFNAKLISQNDERGYTFRGRFQDAAQACSIGVDATQKAHAALRWLIARQGHEDASSKTACVAWTAAGGRFPSFEADTRQLAANDEDALGLLMQLTDEVVKQSARSDVGERYASALKRLLAGYSAKLELNEQAMVMTLAPSTPGRMAVTTYRRLQASELLERVRLWHLRHAWLLPAAEPGGTAHLGAPSPKRILQAAYGPNPKAAVIRRARERVLAGILDGKAVPADIVRAAVRGAVHRTRWGASGHERTSYAEQLAVACALYRGQTFKEENHTMALDTQRTTRDYLFGRLLAIAHRLESDAMWMSNEPLKRLTAAERLQQRFFDRPMTTFKSIDLKLGPYRKRLSARNSFRLNLLERERNAVMALFRVEDFDDGRLSGEALLGYACELAYLEQLLAARRKAESSSAEAQPTEVPASSSQHSEPSNA